MVFLTVRQFAIDQGGDQRKRGERLPVGRGIVSQEKPPSPQFGHLIFASGNTRPMPDRFLPDYGIYLLSRGVQPETRLVFFDLPISHLTRPDLRTVSLTVSTEEGGQEYAISFDFTGPRVEELLAIFPEPRQEVMWR